MKAITEACAPRAEVLKGELEDAIFAADFGHVVEGIAPDVYQKPKEFFNNTYPTTPLKKIVSTIFGRLADPNEAGAAVRLSTGFGGGKTHTLIALWHLARNIAKTTLGTDLLPAAGRPKKVAVAGVDASKFGSTACISHDGIETRSLLGEIAYQLGGKTAYNKVKALDDPTTAPNAAAIRRILPDTPVLLLLDELVVYMAALGEDARGALMAFVNLLVAEVLARPQTVIVITDPAGQTAYQEQAETLAEATARIEAGEGLDQVLGRKMSDFDPIGKEAAQVIVRRLFERLDADAAQAASAEYYNAYQRVASEQADALPPEAHTTDYAKRIVDCYPFHPRLLDTAQNRLGAMQDFGKGRGTLRLFARILRDAWESKSDLPLITAGDINWTSERIQADLLQRLNRDRFVPAVDADIVRHAGELDERFSTDIHRRVASALLLESLPLTPAAAMDKRDLTLATLRPSDVEHEAAEAMDRLMSVCWHTFKDESGLKFQFRYEPNVNKLVEERAETVLPEDARAHVRTLAQQYFGGHTFKLVAYPSSPHAVTDSAQLKLVLCEQEQLAQAVCDYEDDSDPQAKRPRAFRNAIFGIAATPQALAEAVQDVRRLIAAEEIAREEKKGPLKSQVEDLLPLLRKRARIRTLRAFNRVVFHGRPSVTLDERYLVSEDSALENVRGQEQLKKFLDDRKYIYQPTDALDADLLLDEVMKGATPSLDHEGAYSAKAVHERALSHEKLRLMLNESPVRNAILNAVKQGKLVVRLPNGDVHDTEGSVTGKAGSRRRSLRPLTTLPLEDDVLLAPASAQCVSGWVKVDTDEPPPPPPPPPPVRTARTWEEAMEYATTRPLRALKLKAQRPQAAKTLVAVAQPFGAKSLELEVVATGELKDGGNVNFAAYSIKHNHPLKPIDVAARLLRGMADSATFEAALSLDFGEEGVMDAGGKFEQAREAAPEDVGLEAEFGDDPTERREGE